MRTPESQQAVAKAFLFPLHVAEVTLRNDVDHLLCSLYGPDWPASPQLRSILTRESEAALDKAIDRAIAEKGSHPPRGQIVATLTFDFWSNLFRTEYDRPLWQSHLRAVLPNCPPHYSRHDIQIIVRAINHFRNRIAHHEPILKANVTDLHTNITQLVGMRCQTTVAWLKHHSTVSAVIRTRPRSGSAAQTVMSRCDTNFQTVSGNDTLAQVLSGYDLSAPVIIRVDQSGAPTAVLTASDIMLFTQIEAAKTGGMVDLSEHTIDGIVGSAGLGGAWVALNENDPFASAVAALQRKGVKAVVAIRGTAPVGAILRAHRRY